MECGRTRAAMASADVQREGPPAPMVLVLDHDGGRTMGFIGKAIKSGVALKVANMLMREAQKPENQRRAKELFAKARSRKQR